MSKTVLKTVMTILDCSIVTRIIALPFIISFAFCISLFNILFDYLGLIIPTIAEILIKIFESISLVLGKKAWKQHRIFIIGGVKALITENEREQQEISDDYHRKAHSVSQTRKMEKK